MSIAEETSTQRGLLRHDRALNRSAGPATRVTPADRLERLLCCPCGGSFVGHERTGAIDYRCAKCDREGSRSGQQYVFGGFAAAEVKVDWLNRFKEFGQATSSAASIGRRST